MSAGYHEEISDYCTQASHFLARGREYLASGDLHQASESGWGAASHMAKAVAVAQGWDYNSHAEFNQVLRKAAQSAGTPRIRTLGRVASELHSNFYTRKKFLDAEAIGEDLNEISKFLELLGPLTLDAAHDRT